ncbi:MAG: hypothetical protein JO356_16290 [Acidobacteria bacterium]|nr:hypothetical protein [Acidobacteriota bacterium]
MRLLGKLRDVAILLSLVTMMPAFCRAQPDEPRIESVPQSEPPKSAAQTADQPTAEQQKSEAGAASATAGAKKSAAKKRTRHLSTSECGKVVVTNGGAKEHPEQLAPGMAKEEELKERENTRQLLATTDANLKSIAGRQLTPLQQNMLAQIHSFVNQSKAASDAGDLARASTLASKAHLLSDELAKK